MAVLNSHYRAVSFILIIISIFGADGFARNETVFKAELDKKIKDFVLPSIGDWLRSELLIQAITAQNAEYETLTLNEIDALDKQWRSELKLSKAEQVLINSVMTNKLSKHLVQIKEQGKGLYTEIFIMDDKGLNVGQSDITSDYWQGDEAKWQKTYLMGKDAIFIDEVEFDESAQSFQVQVSLSIESQDKVIGAVTIGINANELESLE